MSITKETLFLYIILVVGFFYYIISNHNTELQKYKDIIKEQDGTIQLQTQAIQAQQVQNQYLMRYFYNIRSSDGLRPLHD